MQERLRRQLTNHTITRLNLGNGGELRLKVHPYFRGVGDHCLNVVYEVLPSCASTSLNACSTINYANVHQLEADISTIISWLLQPPHSLVLCTNEHSNSITWSYNQFDLFGTKVARDRRGMPKYMRFCLNGKVRSVSEIRTCSIRAMKIWEGIL